MRAGIKPAHTPSNEVLRPGTLFADQELTTTMR